MVLLHVTRRRRGSTERQRLAWWQFVDMRAVWRKVAGKQCGHLAELRLALRLRPEQYLLALLADGGCGLHGRCRWQRDGKAKGDNEQADWVHWQYGRSDGGTAILPASTARIAGAIHQPIRIDNSTSSPNGVGTWPWSGERTYARLGTVVGVVGDDEGARPEPALHQAQYLRVKRLGTIEQQQVDGVGEIGAQCLQRIALAISTRSMRLPSAGMLCAYLDALNMGANRP
jgi:hypothetical protein